jgi:carboxypeptidase A2
MKWLLACSLLVAAVLSDRVRFDGYKVFDITPYTQEEVAYVHKLAEDVELDFWTEAAIPGLVHRVMIPPHKVNFVAYYLDNQDIKYFVSDDNVQEKIDEEQQRLDARFSSRQPGVNAYDPEDFNTFEDIELELVEMASRCPASIECDVVSVGTSVEGRTLWQLTIHADSGSAKRAIWIDSAIHAREWLAPATILRIMDYMTSQYGSDPDVTSMIDAYDWYFVPIMNPDGYVYSWDTNRNWRKSRNINEGSTCVGTDLNRNYDVNWGTSGISTNPCSDTYCGSSAASEPETVAIEAEFDRLADDLDAVVSFHTAATMWLIPWGHQIDGVCQYIPDHDEMMVILDATVDAVQETHGDLEWARGNSCATIYATSGTTHDYAKHRIPNLPFSATPELRGSFVMPPESITPSFEENWNGIKALVTALQARK